MYCSLFLVSLAAVDVLGSALPELDPRNDAFTTGLSYDINSFFGGDGESSSIPDLTPVGTFSEAPTATTTSFASAATTSFAAGEFDCDSPDTPDTQFLPDVACGLYFDEDLDDFYGHYDFSDASFSAALQDFAPGLPSYDAADFDADDVPQLVTIGGQTFNASSDVRVAAAAAAAANRLRPRTPQFPTLRPEDYETIEEFLLAVAAQREAAEALARQKADLRAQGQADLGFGAVKNAKGVLLMEQNALRDKTLAQIALSRAAIAQSRASAAAAAAATGDSAKVAQIALGKETLPVLPAADGAAPAVVVPKSGVEPLAVGGKVAAAAAVGAAAGDKLSRIQEQAQSAVQIVKAVGTGAAAAPKPVRRRQAADVVDGATIIADLLNGNNNSSNATPAFAYSTVADLTGRFFLTADDSGTLGLTGAPPTADSVAALTFALFGGALAADARSRLLVFFPAAMDALGVSRFRVAALNDTAFDARAAAAIPVRVVDADREAYSVLVPVDSEGVGYALVACNVAVAADEGGARVTKLFVVRDQVAGARTLLDSTTRSEVTGGIVDECFPVALKSPFGSAGV